MTRTLAKLIEDATDDFLVEGDWEKYLTISSDIKTAEDAGTFTRIIRKRLESSSVRSQERALELLQTGMQNNYQVVRAVHVPEFSTFMLDLVRKDTFDYALKNKLLNLLRAWGEAFSNSREGLVNFSSMYSHLRSRNVAFPAKNDDSNYSPPPVPSSSSSSSSHSYSAPSYPSSHVIDSRPGVRSRQQQNAPSNNHYNNNSSGNSNSGNRAGHQPVGGGRASLDSLKLVELLSQQALVQEMLSAVDARVENVQENTLVNQLLSQIKLFKEPIHQALASVQDETLLCQMLQFNDAMLEIEQRYTTLSDQYRTREPLPNVQSSAAPSSSFSALTDALTLDFGFVNLNAPSSKSKTVYGDADSFLPAPTSHHKHAPSHTSPPTRAATTPTVPVPAPASTSTPAPAPAKLIDFDDMFDELANRNTSPVGVSGSKPPASSGGSLLDLLSSPAPAPVPSLPTPSPIHPHNPVGSPSWALPTPLAPTASSTMNNNSSFNNDASFMSFPAFGGGVGGGAPSHNLMPSVGPTYPFQSPNNNNAYSPGSEFPNSRLPANSNLGYLSSYNQQLGTFSMPSNNPNANNINPINNNTIYNNNSNNNNNNNNNNNSSNTNAPGSGFDLFF